MPNVTTRVTAAEKKQLKSEAKKANESLSDLVRRKLGLPKAVMGRPKKKE